MAEEEDSALDLSAEPSRENSKEWASSFTVDGVQYAASIFWESLQNVDAPFLDAKEAAENVLVGADLFCVKHGKSPQLGLAVSSQGFKKGMNVAAVTAVTSMSDASSLLAVFKVDAGYWYLCVRNDVILSDGDVLFVKEEDAKEQFMSMLSVPDWSKKIAPAEWGIDETEQKDISEVWTSNWKRLTPCAAQSWRLSSSFLLQPAHGLLCLLPILFLQRKHKKTKSLPEGLRKKSSRKWKKSFLRRGNPWLIQPGCWTIVVTAFSHW